MLGECKIFKNCSHSLSLLLSLLHFSNLQNIIRLPKYTYLLIIKNEEAEITGNSQFYISAIIPIYTIYILITLLVVYIF